MKALMLKLGGIYCLMHVVCWYYDYSYANYDLKSCIFLCTYVVLSKIDRK